MHRYLLLHEIEVLTIGHETTVNAVRLFQGCESCSPNASTPFGLLVRKLAGRVGPFTDCVLCEPARCPNCQGPVIEGTMIELKNDDGSFAPLELLERPLEATNVVLIDESILEQAQAALVGCERCCEEAEAAFDYILDEITGSDPTTTEYFLCRAGKCPQCLREVTEKTLVVVR